MTLGLATCPANVSKKNREMGIYQVENIAYSTGLWSKYFLQTLGSLLEVISADPSHGRRRIFGVFIAQGTCLAGGCIRPSSVKRILKKL